MPVKNLKSIQGPLKGSFGCIETTMPVKNLMNTNNTIHGPFGSIAHCTTNYRSNDRNYLIRRLPLRYRFYNVLKSLKNLPRGFGVCPTLVPREVMNKSSIMVKCGCSLKKE